MAQIGSSVGMVSQSLTATVDPQGNPLISSDTAFGSSPAGVALLGQQLFGLPNATFNLTPPNVYAALGPDNELPYWDFDDFSDSVMTATPIYDSTAQTWGITINPGTAVSGDYCALTTRAYLLNDDNLGLRQKAFAVIAKTGTAAGTTQWNLTLNAIYYDTTNNPIGTATIGTALDTGTWTGISGFTTAGGTVIPASARYVELQFKLAATATITGTAAVTLKSCLLSSKIGANSSFLITETFTSSTTWTPPTGVTNLVAVVGVGAGGGGGSGGLGAQDNNISSQTSFGAGGGGGASSPWFIARDVALIAGSAITIGVGAGGSGGTAMTYSQAGTGGGAVRSRQNGATGSAGGAATVGSFVSLSGGGGAGGGAGTTGVATPPYLGGTAGTPSVATSTLYGLAQVAATTGGAGGNATMTSSAANAGAAAQYIAAGNRVIYPYTSFSALGTSGGTAVVTKSATGVSSSVANGGPASGTAFFGTSGAGGGAASSPGGGSGTAFVGVGGTASTYGSGGGGGGAAVMWCTAINKSGTALAGAGGNAGANTGCGGGGGGGVSGGEVGSGYTTFNFTMTSGKGGDGANGFVTIVYIA